MKKSIDVLLGTYQVRKTRKQKQDFTSWLRHHLSGFGYELKDDGYSKTGSNLIVGDVATAEIIITAHYDMQPNSLFPMMIAFSNWVSFLLSQIIIAFPMLAVYACCFLVFSAIFDTAVASVIGTLLLLAYCIQMMGGIANRHTANDNTSGVAVLISTLEEMTEEERKKACVVFLDQEELGLIGAKNFYRKYKGFLKDKPLINFDCVGDGGTLTFVVKKRFKNSQYFQRLTAANKAAMADTSKKSRFADALWSIYTSDQLYFPLGVGVAAAKKAPLIGYYINRLHSKWDAKFDNENIELLTDTMVRFVSMV